MEASSLRLFIVERKSGLKILVDTGAEISLLPVPKEHTKEPFGIQLHAANNTKINTYGTLRRSLDFGLRRSLEWTFLLADVPYPILGADALVHFDLIPDLKRKRLIDNTTKLHTSGSVEVSSFPNVSIIDPQHKYAHIMEKFPYVFGLIQPAPLIERGVFHHIETTGPPLAQRARRLSPEKLKAVQAEFQHLCKLGICRPSSSPWASPIHLVQKKSGEWRVCGDYRRLNAVSIPDRYPVPNLHDFSHNLCGRKVFSSIDLERAYHQIPVAKEDIPKTAVITPIGLFEYVVMTFGMRNAGQTFQRLMQQAFGDLDFVFCYIDDVLVASETPEQHEEHLRVVFSRLEKFHLRVNLEKCNFGKTEVIFLGHIVDSRGLRPTSEKVEAVANIPKPKTMNELRRFLGMINFYRSFLPHAAETQLPLNELLLDARKKDNRPVKWSPKSEAAFEKCKADLTNVSLLTHSVMDAEIRIVSDASDLSMGAVLEQKENEDWQPLGFFSKKFSGPQRSYSTYDRELTAIYEAIRHFKHLVEGRQFKVFTDHKPLVYAMMQDPSHAPARRRRQLSYIAEFTSDLCYLPGVQNVVADSLSRIDATTSPTVLNWSKLPQELSNHPCVQQILARIDDFRLPTIFSLEQLSSTQSQDSELEAILAQPDRGLKLLRFTFGENLTPLYCDVQGKVLRPFLPASLRKEVVDLIHRQAHPSAKVTRAIVGQKYVWPHMSKDIVSWVKHCIPCQQSKVTRHNKFLPADFVIPDARFKHVHLDIVGPLPLSEGQRYLLTMTDRYSRWPEAAPMVDMEATTVARAFYETWIARYGAPELVTTDQGKQFEATMFASLLKLFGIGRMRTAGYHPKSNGLVERFHRDLKAALMCYCDAPSWTRFLPTVMLGMRTRIRPEVEASPAEFVFGTVLRIPGEFCVPGDFEPNGEPFLSEYREYMKRIKPVPVTRKYSLKPFVFKDLNSCSHVMMRAKPIKPALDHPYLGPFKVLNRISELNYEIDVNGTSKVVSTERLKPAYFVSQEIVEEVLSSRDPPVNPMHSATSEEPENVCHPAIISEPSIPRGVDPKPLVPRNVSFQLPGASSPGVTPPRTKDNTSKELRLKKPTRIKLPRSISGEIVETNNTKTSQGAHTALQARAQFSAPRTYVRKRIHSDHTYARAI